MGKYKYLIETKGRCFLCLNRESRSAPKSLAAGVIGTHVSVQEPGLQKKPTPKKSSLRKIFQYLKLNFRELLTQTMNILSLSHSQILEETMKLTETLCEDCTHLAERVSAHLSEQERCPPGAFELEVVRMKLYFYIKSLYDRMLKCDQEEHGRLEEFTQEMTKRSETLVQWEVVGRLRRKIVEKCSLKLANPSPQVTVQRLSEVKLASLRLRSSQMMECDMVKEEQADEPVVTEYFNDFDWDVVNKMEGDEGYSAVPAIPNEADKPNNIFECDICGKISTQLDSLNQHRRLFHPDKVLKNLSHVPSENPARITTRVLDNRKFPKPPPGTAVAPSPIEETPNSYAHQRRNVCGVKLNDWTQVLTKHKFKCDLCSLGFLTNMSLQQHNKNVHYRGIKFKCILCDNSFPRKCDLLKHRQKCLPLTLTVAEEETSRVDPHGDRLENQDQDSLRNVGQTTDYSIYNHFLVLATTGKTKPMEESLNSPGLKPGIAKVTMSNDKEELPEPEISRHSKSHPPTVVDQFTQETSRFKCDKCPMNFRLAKDFHRHDKNVHCFLEIQKGTGRNRKPQIKKIVSSAPTASHVDAWTCEYCPGKTFTSTGSLSNHRKRHLEAPSNECTVCFKGFYTQRDLKRHMGSSHKSAV